MIRYNGIYQEGDLVIKKAWRPESLRAYDVEWGKAKSKKNKVSQRATGVCAAMHRVKDTGVMYAKLQAGAEGRMGSFQKEIPVSAEIKKSKDWLRPWSLGRHYSFWGLKEDAQCFEGGSVCFVHRFCLCLISCFVCQQRPTALPWKLLVTLLILAIFWINQEKLSRFMTQHSVQTDVMLCCSSIITFYKLSQHKPSVSLSLPHHSWTVKWAVIPQNILIILYYYIKYYIYLTLGLDCCGVIIWS